MKILTFTTLFPNDKMPNYAVFVKERIVNLAKLCDVRVIAPVPYFPKLRINKKWFLYSQIPVEEEIEGLKVYHPRYFITPKIFRPLYGIFMFLSVFRFVKRLKEEFDFDLIDTHFVYPDGLAAVLLGKFLGKKVTITARGTDINWYPQFKIIRALIRYVLKKADAVVAVNGNLKEKMVNLGIEPAKVRVIPNGVDSNRFFPISKEDARKALNLPLKRRMLLSIGNLVEAKGFHFLIESLKLLNTTDVDLIVIGEGPYKGKLESLVKALNLGDRVRILDQKPHNKLYKWYSAADLFCLTSLREGRPNVVLEALSCGIPIITMNQWGLSDIINKDRGILLDSYETKKIAGEIEKALEWDWNRKKISSFMKNFSWDRTTNNVVELFKNVVSKIDILFFSSDDWDSGLKTSKYHLAINLAKNHRVIFIESIGLRRPQIGKRDIRKVFHKVNKWLKGVRQINDNLFVYTPLLIPLHGNLIIKFFNSFFLRLQIFIIKKKMNIANPLYWTFLPNTVDLLKPHSKRLVYYCVDNMSAFEGVDNVAIRRMDDELTRLAKMVFAVSQPIYKDKKILNKNTHYIPHGVNYAHFADNRENKPPALLNIHSPVIGFYGLISKDWIDFQLLSYIAQSHPEWSIVMIGKIDVEKNDLPVNKNIHYLGSIDYNVLPSYGKFFNVAMIPFNINEVTIYSNPLKLYEYFAMGKPVVSVNLPEIRNLDGMVKTANSYEDFVNRIEGCLKGEDRKSVIKRIEFAKNNSWDKKVEEIWDIVEKHL